VAGNLKAIVELGIFVVREGRIVFANFSEPSNGNGSVVTMIDEPTLLSCPVARATRADQRIG
jgi:hypothetical protein